MAGALGRHATAQSAVRGDRVRTVTDTLVGGVGGVAVDRLGTIYVADFGETVYKVRPDGRVSVFATGLYGSSGNAVDSKGNLLQSNFAGNDISRIDRHGNVERFADGLAGPVGIAVDPNDNLYVCNCRSNAISHVNQSGEVSQFAASDLFRCPNGITRAPDSALYVVNFGDSKVLRVSPVGTVTEFASLPGGGNGHIAYARGHLYATSFQGHRVYKVGMDGSVELFAGTGALGEVDGPALEATFSFPNGIAAGPQGDRLYVNDFLNRFPPTIEVPPVPRSIVRQVTFASFADLLAAAFDQGGLEAMTKTYREWKGNPATASVFTEVQVNVVGYQLMGAGELEGAIELFKMNAESYPQSFNVYDSLGEGYMNAGRTEEAITNYERSLAINPANQNAVRMLEKIRGGSR
jgi:DNA-binding beta-propeller fold protein YncE